MKIGCRLSKRKTTQCGKKKEICNYFNCGLVLEDPRLELTNNAAERAVKPFVIGRKNWLFCDTVKGADSSAIVYSLVESAKANGLVPYDYLLRLLTILPLMGKSPPNEKLDELMPWSIRTVMP